MKKRNKKKPTAVHTALIISLAAVALGSLINLLPSSSLGIDETTGFSRVTVSWTQPATRPESNEVNIAVEDIEDLRTEPTEPETVPPNKPFSGSFVLPLNHGIGAAYSNGEMVENKTMGDWRVHNGIDFIGSKGNDIAAVADGKVVNVYTDDFLGTVAEIDHGNGMLCRYCGLTQGSTPPVNTSVKAGDRIGSLGEIPIEKNEDAHLHFEVLIDGEFVDPLKALNKSEFFE